MQSKTSIVFAGSSAGSPVTHRTSVFHLAVFPLIHNLPCMASLFIDCLPQHCGCGPAHVQPYWILAAPIRIACSIWGQNFQVHVAGCWL